ncbi:cation-translocating P-type ATPase [Amycolatopsis benzoatilytica]|uniref:cation-translocating P-type ATPase n=1 Tax=Amycolatopsis benzoatilytica TaxID=346045 RepID=UPI000A015015|nr:cation-translocating P-type ATPase [Amycolatopsis benzoatilytica]
MSAQGVAKLFPGNGERLNDTRPSVISLAARLPLAGFGLAMTAPTRMARSAGKVLDVAAEAASLGADALTAGAGAGLGAAASAARVLRKAVRSGAEDLGAGWRNGRALHLRLRPAEPGDKSRFDQLVHKVIREALAHPDVVAAYWDAGLSRMVVTMAEGAAGDRIVAAVSARAERHGLSLAPQDDTATHPGDLRAVKTQAAALAISGAGLATAVLSAPLRLRRPPQAVLAALTAVREHPLARDFLRAHLGRSTAELAVATANAALHGFGNSPADLALDAVLRTGQLADAVAQVVAFERTCDRLCTPGRESPAARPARRPAPGDPVTDYAKTALTGGLLGAAGTALFSRGAGQASSAVLASSPKPARYAWTAYASGLGLSLARERVLVRSPDRLRLLPAANTLVVHGNALRGERRTVVEAHPSDDEWEEGRLWQAAVRSLDGADSPVRLRPVPDNPAGTTGLMIASAGGAEVGTVLVGYAPDPLAESVLDAAGRAGLRIVVVQEDVPGVDAALADEVATGQAMADVVTACQEDGNVVVTVARVPASSDEDARDEVLTGLLRGDLSVAVANDCDAVVWAADLLSVNGLAGVWRLVHAVGGARTAGDRATTCAEAAAALSGLVVATGGQRQWRRLLSPLARLSPVNLATAVALAAGWQAVAAMAAEPVPPPRPRVAWHALPPDEVRRQLSASPQRDQARRNGLPQRAQRLASAAGQLPGSAPLRTGMRLAGAMRTELGDPLTPVLAVGAAASAILGSAVDALLVLAAMGINALVGGVQGLRAEQALAGLTATQAPRARRVPERDEAPEVVDAAGLAPGDLVDLQVGDVVPADARLLCLTGLEVDESVLTGESLPVAKRVAATPAADLADRLCMVFEGTTVVAGSARAIVADTGDRTEAGRAVALASRTAPAAGVQARLRELTRKALPLTLAGGAAVTGLSLLRGRTVREAISGGVAVAVAAVPEGLPLVATVAQTAAARRLSRRGVLVRSARTLEALGRIDTVCFDKTGTLTRNELRVIEVATANGETHPVRRANRSAAAAETLRAGARACPAEEDNGRTGHAHATDAAVLAAAPPDPEWRQVASLPFEASRGYAAAAGLDGETGLLEVKGALEVVLPCCPKLPAGIPALAESLTGTGLRVLAVARRRVSPERLPEAADEPLGDLEFVGLLALADSPRPHASEMVSGLREAGVTPVVLTGDHPRTALAIATELGWPDDTTVVTGQELAALDRAGRANLLRGAGIVARVAPEQKLQVVEALRAAGRVVAMVGDGANDAAAIRAADAGIALAARGSAAARNAADIVLTDGDLRVLVDAVDEGRALWRSVADAISILIGGNAGEVGFTVLGTLLSGTSPLSTRQLLLVNLLTDMFPAMAIAVTPSAEEGNAAGTGSLGSALTRQIRNRGIVTGLGATTSWLAGALTPGSARRTSTMSLCGLVGAQLVQTLVGRSHSPLVLATGLGSAAALFAVVQTPGVSHFFGCTPLGPVAWAGVGGAIAVAAVTPPLLPALERVAGRFTDRLPAVRLTR